MGLSTVRIVSTMAGCRSGSPKDCFSRFCSALVRVQEGERRQLARGSGCRPGENMGWINVADQSLLHLLPGLFVPPAWCPATPWAPLQCVHMGLGAAWALAFLMLPEGSPCSQGPTLGVSLAWSWCGWGVGRGGRSLGPHTPVACMPFLWSVGSSASWELS